MAERWLRPDEIIQEVANWTGIDRSDLLIDGTARRATRRQVRARVLLAHCLQSGLDCSKLEVARIMGYRADSRGRQLGHLFNKDWDPSEVATVVNMAMDRAQA